MSSQNKIVKREIKITKNALVPAHAFSHAARTSLATLNERHACSLYSRADKCAIQSHLFKTPALFNSSLANAADMFVNETNYIVYL